MRSTRCFLLASAVCVVAAAFPSDADCSVRYTVVDLGTLGGSTSTARDINSDGEIVGHSHIAGDSTQHGFFWEPDTEQMRELGTLPSPLDQGSWGYGMNDSSWAVGASGTNATLQQHGILWGPGGEIVDLGTLGGSLSWAYDINGSCQVVGGSLPGATNKAHAFLWKDGEMKDLGTLGGDDSFAIAINDSGQVAGTSRFQMDSDLTHAFRWEDENNNGEADDEEREDLGTLGGSRSSAGGMNGHGVVVGGSNPPGDSVECAFVWDPTNGMRELPGLGGNYTRGTDINNNGVIVGFGYTSDNSSHACIWYSEDGILDLNELIPSGLGWELTLAHAINDDGKIVGSGFHNGQREAFLLNPITNEPPEAVVYVYPSAPVVGDKVDLEGSGSNDPDEDDLTYSWSVSDPDGTAVPVSNPTLVEASFVPEVAGEHVISLVVSDGKVSDEAIVTVVVIGRQQAAIETLVMAQEKISALGSSGCFKNKNSTRALINKVDAVIDMILGGEYDEAVEKLENDILKKVDGCCVSPRADKNDWIKDCDCAPEDQGQLCSLIIAAIGFLDGIDP